MMLNTLTIPQSPFVRAPRCVASSFPPFCSTPNAEELRTQIERLHTEAEAARAKASNARLRLMRLSEAAEKVHQQAALCVRTGKEAEARELLFQKKKLLQALQKSKNRIELFDELSAKLNEAVSVRETQLIGKVKLAFDIYEEDASHSVPIVLPNVAESSNENECYDPALLEDGDDQVSQISDERFANQTVEASGHAEFGSKNRIICKLTGISSYEGFLEHVDQQLREIEAELDTVLMLSTLVLESEEKQKNSKVQETQELQDSIHSIRRRIADKLSKKLDIR